MRDIRIEPISEAAFAPYGDLLDANGDYRLINDGLCRRHHDRARLEFDPAGRAGISIFSAEPRQLPYFFDLIERHPEGSQAFIPLYGLPFLVIVADAPGERPRAFRTSGAEAVNLHRGTWHGVLTPLSPPGLFAVVDRIGPGPNLEEYRYSEPWRVVE